MPARPAKPSHKKCATRGQARRIHPSSSPPQPLPQSLERGVNSSPKVCGRGGTGNRWGNVVLPMCFVEYSTNQRAGGNTYYCCPWEENLPKGACSLEVTGDTHDYAYLPRTIWYVKVDTIGEQKKRRPSRCSQLLETNWYRVDMIASKKMVARAARSLSRRKERSPAQASLVSIGKYDQAVPAIVISFFAGRRPPPRPYHLT